MNLLDALVVAVALMAGWGGSRMGLAGRALAWAGLAVGAVFAIAFIDDVTQLFRSSPPRTRFVVALGFFLLVCVAGQAAGLALGSLLRHALPTAGPLRLADRLGGAAAGVLSVLVALWLLTPALSSAPGWPARAVRGSVVAKAVQDVAPAPPGSLAALGRLVGDAPFPEVFRQLVEPEVGEPPGSGLSGAVAAKVAESVVRVEGQACEVVQEGSGFFATPDLVVTNAHVVAGERATAVSTPGGRRFEATVVAFDARRDLAVLRVPPIGAPLRLATARVGMLGAVFGHPGGGPLREAPARVAQIVEAEGSDIYRSGASRRGVLVLAARLAPGDSGAPVVDSTGRVVGAAFAVDPGSPSTAYALSRAEIEAVLSPVAGAQAAEPADTGPCLLG